MNSDTLIHLHESIVKEIYPYSCDDQVQRRVASVADFLLSHTPGNILEIGAGQGVTTLLFLKTASKLNKKVFVVDPFESGIDNPPDSSDVDDYYKSFFSNYSYDSFLERTSDYKNYLTVFKSISQDDSLKKEVMKTVSDVKFAFVDGLQDNVENVLSDLELMGELKTHLICVDDYHSHLPKRNEIVREAIKIFTEKNPYIEFPTNGSWGERVKEGYIIRVDEGI